MFCRGKSPKDAGMKFKITFNFRKDIISLLEARDEKKCHVTTGAPSSKQMVYATACVYRELYGKITDRKKIV